jgi:diadenosine tetraphosphatase ApaH/serine/threonine PP2A family protein phosphatase
VCEIPHEGPFCDLMWSDPEDIETWAVSPRGAGWLFGCKVTAEFNQINGETQGAGGARARAGVGVCVCGWVWVRARARARARRNQQGRHGVPA